MRVAADTALTMAAHAQGFARATVARGALRGIAPGSAAVLIALTSRTQPSGRVGAARIARRGSDTKSLVTRLTRVLTVAGAAEPGLGASFFCVPGSKSRSVHARTHHVIEE
jgi:hypothetical protein